MQQENGGGASKPGQRKASQQIRWALKVEDRNCLLMLGPSDPEQN